MRLPWQAQQLEHVIFAGCTHPAAVDLAERLVAILPPGLSRVFYSGQRFDRRRSRGEDGAAVLGSTPASRGGARSSRCTTAYHGDTVGAMSVSEDSIFTRAFRAAPVLRDPRPRAVTAIAARSG